MNTADRSIALVDSALRRRFFFDGFSPTKGTDRHRARAVARRQRPRPRRGHAADALNAAIDDEDFSIGPSYFMTGDGAPPDLGRIWDHAIMPLLRERYYGTGETSKPSSARTLWRSESSRPPMRLRSTTSPDADNCLRPGRPAVHELAPTHAQEIAASGLVDVESTSRRPSGSWSPDSQVGVLTVAD